MKLTTDNDLGCNCLALPPCRRWRAATLQFRRLFVALALAACAIPSYSQEDFLSEAPEASVEPDDALQSPAPASGAQSGKAEQVKDHLARAEAARRRGNFKAQITELRRAHELARGRDSGVVNQLAAALLQSGDRDGARRLRETLVAADIPPAEKLAHAAALTVYAADIGDIDAASRWMANADSLQRQLGESDNLLLARTRLHWSRSALLLAQGKFREGEAESRLASSALRRLAEGMGGTSSANLRYWQNLIDTQIASTLARQGRMAESEWVYRGTLARSTREAGARSLQSARFALDLASTQLRQGRHEEALGQASAALASLGPRTGPEFAHTIANAHLLIGWSEVMAGRHEAAVTAFEQRARLLGDSAAGSAVWGYAMIRADRAQAALPMLRAHYEAGMRASPTLYATRERAGMYAYALQRAGRTGEAKQLFAASLPALLRARQGRRATDRADILLETISNWIIEGCLESLWHEAESGDTKAIAEMFRLAEVARGSTVQRALALASTRARIEDPELATIARREQDLGNILAARGRALEELLELPRGQSAQQSIAELRRDIGAATRERDTLRREIALRFPKYSQLIEPRPLSTTELLKLLKPGEVMIATYSAHDRTYTWAIPQSGAIRFAGSTLGAAAITATVRKLRAALDVGNVPLAAFPAFDTATAYSLYRQLLAPLESAWSKADTLIVVPHGALGQLPFALLPTAPAANAHSTTFEGYRRVPWLIRKAAIAQLPSVSALAALRASPASAAAASLAFAGFGDPQFRAPTSAPEATHRDLQVRNLGRSLNAPAGKDPGSPASVGISRLPQLPDTALELREIAAILKAASSDVLLGTEASETNVKRRSLERYRVLMFATHGLAPGELDGLTQPALALSNPELTGEQDADGLLTLDEVLGLKLAADWVVLSACNTAAGDGAGSEAVSGLGRAFFYAGARALLVSHWPVETVSARLITTDLFRRQNEDPALTRGQALRQTLLNLIDRGEAQESAGRARFSYAHPMFWAPFTLVGDAG